MATYLIKIPHTPQECAVSAEEFIRHPRAREILSKTHWGCSSGNHIAWIVADFDNETEIKELEPNTNYTATPVETFSYDQVLQVHQ